MDRDARLDALACINACRFGVSGVVEEVTAELAADPERLQVMVGALAWVAAYNADLLAERGLDVDAGMRRAAGEVVGRE
jgi:hypothetical protein